MRPLAAALLRTSGYRVVLEGSFTGAVSLSVQRWQRGDLCVTVLATALLPAGFDEEALASAVLSLLSRAHDRAEMQQAATPEAGG